MDEAPVVAPAPPCIAVCMKWVALRPEIDPITGAVATDERWSGASLADRAALEWALRLAEPRGARVVVVSVATLDCRPMLRDALACGAHLAVRVDQGGIDSPTSRSVAAALAEVLAPLHPLLVLCGDWSADRGSASVPPFLAGDLGVAQACGLVSLAPQLDGSLVVERRLDGGRRERIRVTGRAVLSVEGVTAQLRRATVKGMLDADDENRMHQCTSSLLRADPPVVRSGPYRPRARILDAPHGEDPRNRVLALTGAMVAASPPQRLHLTPAAAADRIVEQLNAWGYLTS